MKFDLPSGKPHLRYVFQQKEPLLLQSFFRKKTLCTVTIMLTATVLYIVSALMTGFTAWNAFTGIPRGLYWLVLNFSPSPEAFSVFPAVFRTLLDTAIIAITASTCAFCGAILASIAGSQTTGRFFLIRLLCAGSASFFRNIPLPAWSILLLLSFKQNAVTGFLALFFITAGHLTRAFTEIIDSHAEEAYTALEAAGVSYFPIIIHGVFPNTLPLFISWLLYAIETNVRDSALIGILTGTGIGFLFNLYFKSFRYHEAGLIICISMIIVLCIDVISNTVRRILL